MKSFKTAAIEILKEAERPMHYREITQLALDKGILHTNGKTPEDTMNSKLNTEISTLGDASSFIRTARAIFALNPNKQEEKKQSKKPQPNKIPVDKFKSGFIGKAGEHYVAAELLFRGFNASIMSVDIGMDIIATNNNKLYSLQVKTSNLHPNNAFIFDIKKVALERDHAGREFYVFVMIHDDESKSALILPAIKINELIDSNAIKDLKSAERFRVTLKIRKNNIYIGTLDNEINYYWNKWEVIK